MAITFPRTLPSSVKILRVSQWRLETNNDVFEAPLSRKKQILVRPGALWRGVIEFVPMTKAEAIEFKAWLVSLEGEAGTFYFYDPANRLPSGTASTVAGDTPLVSGAGQLGSSLNVDGFRINQVGLLLPGDYISVSGQLKMVTEQVDSDGLGAATINFKSALHSTPADNAVVTFENPTGIFQLADSNQDGWDIDGPYRHRFAVAIIERPQL